MAFRDFATFKGLEQIRMDMNMIKNSLQSSSLLCNFDHTKGLQVPFLVQKVRDDIQDDTTHSALNIRGQKNMDITAFHVLQNFA